MKTRSQVLTCFLLAALAVPALAAPDDGPKLDRKARKAERQQRKAERAKKRAKKQAQKALRENARAFTKRLLVPPEQLKANVAKLQTELTWHDDLAEARQAAVQSGKPILWIQALGDLSGLL